MSDDDKPQIPGHNSGGTLTPFVPGESRAVGRPPGAQARITRILKEAILQAAQTVGKPRIKRGKDGRILKVERGAGGLDGYLEHLALNEPRVFGGLLNRILPVSIKAEVTDKKVYKTFDQLRAELKARGIPVDEMVAEERAKVVKLRLPKK
jgi:hypothetical protein